MSGGGSEGGHTVAVQLAVHASPWPWNHTVTVPGMLPGITSSVAQSDRVPRGAVVVPSPEPPPRCVGGF
jgi:hypothetical protein